MNINCFQISEGPVLTQCEYSIAINAIRQKSARTWIDILDAGPGELEEKLDDLGIQGLIRRFCFDSGDHPGFYPLKPLALMIIPVQREVQDSNVMDYLNIIFSVDFLITIRSSRMARFRKNLSSQDSSDLLPDDSIGGLISALLMGLSLDCLRKTARLSDMIMTLEETMERNPDSVLIEDMSGKRSEVLTLESIVQGQLPIIETIISSDRPSKSPETTVEYLRWAAANLKSAHKKLEWIEHRIEVIRSTIDMYAQDRTNRRLGRLTVLSAIFMPITFLVGVWGMNFSNMPLLSVQFGFFMALVIIFLLAGGMFLYFKKKGWFE
jgi:magnesium transporter